MIPTVCFIACHGASADHFATFIQNTPPHTANVLVYASQQMAAKFEDKKIDLQGQFSIDNPTSEEATRAAIKIAKECATASVVLTDVGHRFSSTIQKALTEYAPTVTRLAYYDNPETYVPGGYSTVAAEVMCLAQWVLFANANLAEMTLYQEPNKAVDLTRQKKIGLGYYPIQNADTISYRRANEQAALRQKILSSYELADLGQKIVVYFGGNNEEYFTKAFPAFLSLLAEALNESAISQTLFVLQQHPAAKTKNLDGQNVSEWIEQHAKAGNCPKFIVSDFASDIAQIIADGALYYQTSMGPQFVLAGIPTAQIGHEPYEDILVRGALIKSITKKDQLIDTLNAFCRAKQQGQEVQREVIERGLGIKHDWPQILSRMYTPERL
jgi:hypothetical protein